MPKPKDEAHEFVHLQHKIATLLAAMYLQEQQNMAEQVPQGWRPHTIIVPQPADGKSITILPGSAQRFNVRIFNDGTSDLIIANTDFDQASILQQYNGVAGQQINAFVIPSGANLQLDSAGTITAAPFKTDGTACKVRMIETIYELTVTGALANGGFAARNDGHKWNGLSASVPGIITSLV